MHRLMADTLDRAFDKIRDYQQRARRGETSDVIPRWPMIILRSPKGWTGPKPSTAKVEDFWRAHQVPVASCREDDGHRQILEQWMRSYQPETLFDEQGRLRPELRALAPQGEKRMGASPYANGGRLRRELDTPDIREFAVNVTTPGEKQVQSTEVLGQYLRAIFERNKDNFRLFGPDETASNRLSKVFDVTSRTGWKRCARMTNSWPLTDG